MTDLTHEDLMQAMEAKSDQLNAVDLIAGPITVKIVGARRGDDKKQLVVLDIEGYEGKPWKPCKTQIRIMAEVWKVEGDTKLHPERWVGQTVTLYRDPEVIYAGDKVSGVRLSHMSGLTEPRTFVVAETRGKPKKKVIHPIEATPEPTPEEQVYIDETVQSIAGVSTLEELQNLGAMMKDKSVAIRVALRGPYAARKEELK